MENKYIEEIRINIPEGASGYPFSLPAVRAVERAGGLVLRSQVTFLTGENGTGKSTLIEAAAVAAGFNPEGGSKNFSFETDNTVSPLWEHITLSRAAYPKDGFFLRAESMYNAATYLDSLPGASGILCAYGGRSLHEQSHGESFMAVIKQRLRGHGLYIFDEPEAALSPSRQMMLLKEMKKLCDLESQFIISTHSPILLAYPGAQIFEIHGGSITQTEYDRCRNVRLYRDFLKNTKENIDYLMSEDENDTV